MREYRGKRKSDGEWVHGWYVGWDGSPKTEDDADYIVMQDISAKVGNSAYKFFAVIPETVGQYIGHKDKNDQIAFVGDVIRVTTFHDGFSERCHTGAIRFAFGTYELQIGEMDGKPFDSDILDEIRLSDVEYEFEVIGNIWDNPELLKEV